MVRSRTAWVLVAALGLAMASGARLEAQGPSEGIRVRGHWVLEVRNPDGGMASRTEFDNALLDGGRVSLSSLLRGIIRVGHWQIAIKEGVTDTCFAWQFCWTIPTASVDAANDGIALRASYTSENGTRIDQVGTRLTTCAVATATSHCDSTWVFSGTNLPSSLVLEAGQILQVTVTISFSAAPHAPSF